MTATLNDFLKPIPCEVVEYESEHFGTVRIRTMSRSQSNDYQQWLKPSGKVSDRHNKHRDLKLVTMSVVDEAGNPVFNFDDDEAFFDFADSLDDAAAEPWDDLIYKVMEIQGYFKKADDLLGKSEN